ncbi:UNKNOWN [Stylonychia lemnae]|uniref:Uncharacterized protein n=1 Tax=Stylonychia lemnae TaxID=5949 RepID=A0A078AMG2_STYLE|nr:UNKNOWN [Stylonychia lemnae]|eukprot:CDW82043.1 UNKNOWN [Stylonychia lemnae]
MDNRVINDEETFQEFKKQYLEQSHSKKYEVELTKSCSEQSSPDLQIRQKQEEEKKQGYKLIEKLQNSQEQNNFIDQLLLPFLLEQIKINKADFIDKSISFYQKNRQENDLKMIEQHSDHLKAAAFMKCQQLAIDLINSKNNFRLPSVASHQSLQAQIPLASNISRQNSLAPSMNHRQPSFNRGDVTDIRNTDSTIQIQQRRYSSIVQPDNIRSARVTNVGFQQQRVSLSRLAGLDQERVFRNQLQEDLEERFNQTFDLRQKDNGMNPFENYVQQ